MTSRDRRTYDHRLRELVWRTQNTAGVAHLSIPHSTLDDWQRTPPTPVVTMDNFDREANELRAEVLLLRRLVNKLLILLRLLAALIKSLGVRLDGQRLPEGKDKARVLHALKRSRTILPFRIALRAIGLSPSRFHAWRHASTNCELNDRYSCLASLHNA